jgi:hypothetical protein
MTVCGITHMWAVLGMRASCDQAAFAASVRCNRRGASLVAKAHAALQAAAESREGGRPGRSRAGRQNAPAPTHCDKFEELQVETEWDGLTLEHMRSPYTRLAWRRGGKGQPGLCGRQMGEQSGTPGPATDSGITNTDGSGTIIPSSH